jgi:hypothetical protein
MTGAPARGIREGVSAAARAAAQKRNILETVLPHPYLIERHAVSAAICGRDSLLFSLLAGKLQ